MVDEAARGTFCLHWRCILINPHPFKNVQIYNTVKGATVDEIAH